MFKETLEIPKWIDADYISADTGQEYVSWLSDVVTFGCASGAYWPAVHNYSAVETMGQYGQAIFDALDGVLDELTPPTNESWAALCVYYVSAAVELWAMEQLNEF